MTARTPPVQTDRSMADRRPDNTRSKEAERQIRTGVGAWRQYQGPSFAQFGYRAGPGHEIHCRTKPRARRLMAPDPLAPAETLRIPNYTSSCRCNEFIMIGPHWIMTAGTLRIPSENSIVAKFAIVYRFSRKPLRKTSCRQKRIVAARRDQVDSSAAMCNKFFCIQLYVLNMRCFRRGNVWRRGYQHFCSKRHGVDPSSEI